MGLRATWSGCRYPWKGPLKVPSNQKHSVILWSEGRVQRRQSHTVFSDFRWRHQRQWSQTNSVGSLWISGNTFSLWGWPNTGKGCPGRWWSLHSWRYSRVVWMWSWATCSKWPYLSKDFGQDDLQRSLPTSAILWFCDLWFVAYHVVLILYHLPCFGMQEEKSARDTMQDYLHSNLEHLDSFVLTW